MPTNVRDPRSIVTPEAFEIDEKLLGIPLARPIHRLIALIIDLVVIGVLTAYSEGFGVFIWGIVSLVLLRIAFSRPTRMGKFTSVLFRGVTGCLGLIVLVSVGGILFVRSLDEGRLEEAISGFVEAGDLAGLPAAVDLGTATSREEAEALAQRFLETAGRVPLEGEADEGLAAALEAFIGEDPQFTDDPGAFAREMVALFRSGGVPAEEVALGEDEMEELAGLELPEALSRYREGIEEGRSPDDDPEMTLLRSRLAGEISADTLAALQARLARVVASRDRTEEALVEAQRALDERPAGLAGLAALLRDMWDQAGSAVGLWSLYFTITLTLFRGFTVGKRMMGIRVIRLDGEPMTWWSAFERGGGYVAGIATGLLGFAQVYWDPNRQCVHDKIVGTVVVVAGAAPIEGAVESAWSADPND